MVVAISFIEAPLKFQAPGITTELGLGIGRLVFGALNTAELVLLAVVTVTSLWRRRELGQVYWVLFAWLVITMGVQSGWLLPVLDARAATILEGESIAKSFHHVSYGILEVLKVVTLTALFLISGAQVSGLQPNRGRKRTG